MESRQLFARLIRAVHAMFYSTGHGALPDSTNVAKTYNPLTLAPAAFAIDILGLEMDPELFRIQSSGIFSGFEIIILRSQKGGTVRTIQSAIPDHFSHDASFFPVP
jgi:hypothetical protein